MLHPLRVGQVFRCHKFASLVHDVSRDSVPPVPDKSKLRFGSAIVHLSWTEKGEDGWERKRNEAADFSVEDPGSLAHEFFTVVKVALTGGGTGHGPGDVFPDGHFVTARGTSGRTVCFYQTGCFAGLVAPEDVELTDGPPDAPGRWESVYVVDL